MSVSEYAGDSATEDEGHDDTRPSGLLSHVTDLLSNPRGGGRFRLRRSTIVQLLREAVLSHANKQQVLQLRHQHAERLLNIMQDVLDDPESYHPSFPDDELFLRSIFRLFMRLAQHSKVLPPRLFLEGVALETRDPLNLGGFADVFRGTWKGQIVAIKRLRVTAVDSEEGEYFHRAFYREALIWRQLRHRYVLPFVGIDRVTFAQSRLFCMVSPWMSRGPVLYYARGDIGVHERLRLLQEVAEGISHLHSEHVVHGDIRGLNIFLTESLHVQLADFGLSVIGDKTTVGAATATKESGAKRWMGPELLDPDRFELNFERTPSSDTFAFGGLGLEIFTGKQPFADVSNEVTVMFRLLEGINPRQPTEEEAFGHGVPEDMWALMVHCWAYRPIDRPPMPDVAAAIEGFLTSFTSVQAATFPPQRSNDAHADAADLDAMSASAKPQVRPLPILPELSPRALSRSTDSLSDHGTHSATSVSVYEPSQMVLQSSAVASAASGVRRDLQRDGVLPDSVLNFPVEDVAIPINPGAREKPLPPVIFEYEQPPDGTDLRAGPSAPEPVLSIGLLHLDSLEEMFDDRSHSAWTATSEIRREDVTLALAANALVIPSIVITPPEDHDTDLRPSGGTSSTPADETSDYSSHSSSSSSSSDDEEPLVFGPFEHAPVWPPLPERAVGKPSLKRTASLEGGSGRFADVEEPAPSVGPPVYQPWVARSHSRSRSYTRPAATHSPAVHKRARSEPYSGMILAAVYAAQRKRGHAVDDSGLEVL